MEAGKMSRWEQEVTVRKIECGKYSMTCGTDQITGGARYARLSMNRQIACQDEHLGLPVLMRKKRENLLPAPWQDDRKRPFRRRAIEMKD